MFMDFILLWSASIAILKYSMNGYLSVETGGLLLVGAMFVVSITRIMRSNVFRQRSRIPTFFCSLAFFALSVADGDVRKAVDVAIISAALPICLFGLYICFRSAFGRM